MPTLPRLRVTPPRGLRADALAVFCFAGEPPPDLLRAPLAAAARRLAERPGWRGEEEQRVESASPAPGVGALVLRGLGRRGELDAVGLGRRLAAAVDEARRNRVPRLAVALPDHPVTSGEPAAERVATQLLAAAYAFDRYREKPAHRLREIALLRPAGEQEPWRRAARRAVAVAEGAALARDLANTPPNDAHPEWLAEEARAWARRSGFRVTVLGARDLERRGMGGLLAVGGGSARGPRLVRLEGGEGEPTVALVGKGVTFDTGGISIKPAAAMEEMKYDKSGACTVLGILHGAAALGLPARLRAYLPLAENMPDGRAYRPGDIVRCYGGKTVEVLNTDAEGRMILADALAWAAEERPDALLEYSTLTGASVVALGHGAAALYSPADDLAAQLLEAAAASGERLWRMPLWPEFAEEMKGTHADLKNSGGRWGGANTAAAFLAQFVEPLRRWAHLDIAGPAYVGADGKGAPGATGYGVATTLGWLRRVAV